MYEDLYNDFYDEELLLEKKKEEDDEEDKEDNKDDGLLSHGIGGKHHHKENPLYTDYKNQQIMNGKVVKSEKGWKKEEKAKKFLRRAAMVAGAGLVIGGGVHVHKMKNDAGYREKVKANRRRIANSKGYDKKAKDDAYRMGYKDAEIDGKALRIKKQAEHKAKIDQAHEEAGHVKKKIGPFTYWSTNNEELYYNDLNNYLVFAESKSNAELLKDYEDYVEKCLEKGKDPMTFKEYKKHKERIKKNIGKAIAGTAVVGGLVANGIIHNKTGKSIPEHIRFKKQDRQTEKTVNQLNQDKKTISKIRNSALFEDIASFNDYDIDSYLESLNDVDSFKKSYHSYCVMMESKGLKPLDENAFSDAKEKLADYAKAAIDGIKEKKKEEDEKIDKIKKEKEEERKKEKEKEKEMLDKMSPEQKKAYLAKKAKEDAKKEREEEEKHELKHHFKKAVLQGSGEQLGKSAVKLVTKGFM